MAVTQIDKIARRLLISNYTRSLNLKTWDFDSDYHYTLDAKIIGWLTLSLLRHNSLI